MALRQCVSFFLDGGEQEEQQKNSDSIMSRGWRRLKEQLWGHTSASFS